MPTAEPRAENPHVQLRAVTDADLPIFFEHQQDPAATQMAAFPSREHDAFMAHWARVRDNPTNITRTILAGGEVAGYIGSWEQEGAREVGYWLGRDYWGRGIATQGLAAFLQLVTSRPLYAHVVKHNVGSRRVLEKNGFIVCGEDQGMSDADGTAVEEWLLILRPQEDTASR